MKQTTKITLLSIWSIIATIIIVVATGIFAIKNTWRIAPDFSLCEDPEKIRPVVTGITDDCVKFQVQVPGIGFFYEGYKCDWEQNETGGVTLYIGVKYIPLLGSGGQLSIFHIPRVTSIDRQSITKIIACGHGKERVIYDIESDQNKLQDYTNTSSEATSSLN